MQYYTIIYKSNITFVATYSTFVNQTRTINLAAISVKMLSVKESISITFKTESDFLNFIGFGTD